MDENVSRVWLLGQERRQAMTCKRCNGPCSLWSWVHTPLKWNPERLGYGLKCFRHADRRFRREREKALGYFRRGVRV